MTTESSPSTTSKPDWNKLWTPYLTIGSALAAPVMLSYLYAMLYVSWHGSFAQAGSMVFIMLGSAAARLFLWPLSFGLWLVQGHGGFWQWLAPGFFVTVGG